MTEDHKQKISQSCKGKAKNTGKIWITNGVNITRIYPSELESYINKGYTRGKKQQGKTQVPWNKGLTIKDSRVQKYIKNRKG